MLTLIDKLIDFERLNAEFQRMNDSFERIARTSNEYTRAVIQRSADLKDTYFAQMQNLPKDWYHTIDENDDPTTGLTQRTETYESPDGRRRYVKSFTYSKDAEAAIHAANDLHKAAQELKETEEAAFNAQEVSLQESKNVDDVKCACCEADFEACESDFEVDEDFEEHFEEDFDDFIEDLADELQAYMDELNLSDVSETTSSQEEAETTKELHSKELQSYEEKIQEIEKRVKSGDLLKAHELLSSLVGKQ